jgi:hypothetical protein
MYTVVWCAYGTLRFDIVSTIVEALVIALHQFLYHFIVEWCRLRCKARGNGVFDLVVVLEPPASKEGFKMQEQMKITHVLSPVNLCSSISIFSTQRAHNFRNFSLSDKISWRRDREIWGKCKESDVTVNSLFSLIFSSTARTKSSFTTDGQPLRGSSCTFSRPSLNSRTHLRTIELLMACSAYSHKVDDEFQLVSFSSHSRNRLQTAFHIRQDSPFSLTL